MTPRFACPGLSEQEREGYCSAAVHCCSTAARKGRSTLLADVYGRRRHQGRQPNDGLSEAESDIICFKFKGGCSP